jgi:hypothetical protein
MNERPRRVPLPAGGILTLLTTAGHPELPIRNMMVLATPCDYREMGFMSNMFADGRLDADDVIDETGLAPAASSEPLTRLPPLRPYRLRRRPAGRQDRAAADRGLDPAAQRRSLRQVRRERASGYGIAALRPRRWFARQANR